MTNQQHPIRPPLEMVKMWLGEFSGDFVSDKLSDSEKYLAIQAVQWGADQELEACCEWVSQWCRCFPDGTRPEARLCITRRPKLPSLKEQALEALEHIDGYAIQQMSAYAIHDKLKNDADTIRCALEALPE